MLFWSKRAYFYLKSFSGHAEAPFNPVSAQPWRLAYPAALGGKPVSVPPISVFSPASPFLIEGRGSYNLLP